MKKIITVVALYFTSLMVVCGQDIEIREGLISTDDILTDGLIMAAGNDVDFARKKFIEFVKKDLGAKANRKGKSLVVAYKVTLPEVIDKRGDLKALFFSERDTVMVGVAFVLGYDIFINSENYPIEMHSLKGFFRDFQEFLYTEHYNELILDQEKRKKDLERDIAKAERQISSLGKRIESNTKKVSKTEDASKKSGLHSKNAEHNTEIAKLTESIPVWKDELIQVEQQIGEKRTDLNTLLTRIKEARTYNMLDQRNITDLE